MVDCPLRFTAYDESHDGPSDRLREGERWINGQKDGIDWYDVITQNGLAYGAVTKGDYTDPTALLKGVWGKNQYGKAKVFREIKPRSATKRSKYACAAR
jgi:hypothetical protein